MSEFTVEVVEINHIEKHPNADSLSIAYVRGDYPVIFRTGQFHIGSRAVYVPIDSVVPEGDTRWDFLAGHRRIKAKKLRGVFSMGLLTEADPSWTVGQNVQEALGIVKYEPDMRLCMSGQDEKDPGFLPVYTDIEGLRRHPNVLVEGEDVVLTEKLHGSNGRWLYRDGRLWIGSHKRIKDPTIQTIWSDVAKKYDLEAKLATIPDIAIYGEVFGQVQDLKYGAKLGELRLALFDAFHTLYGRYLNYHEFRALAYELELPTVPELYRGPWHADLRSLSEGKTTLSADHCREGFVVKPVVERVAHCGRVIFKLVGETYLLRKEA